jgi:hypothetical protein
LYGLTSIIVVEWPVVGVVEDEDITAARVRAGQAQGELVGLGPELTK